MSDLHHIQVYDNGGKSFDRFAVVFETPGSTLKDYLGLSENALSPQGFAQHGQCRLGDHLGKLISFDELPADCQSAVRRDFGGLAFQDTTSGKVYEPRVETIATYQVISRNIVKAEFQAVKGDAGKVVVHYHLRGGSLKPSGTTGANWQDSDDLVQLYAHRAAEIFVQQKCKSGKVVLK